MLSLYDVLGIPPTKVYIDISSIVSFLIPPVVFYAVTAILAVTPQTRVFRVALCPIVALLCMRAALSVDLASGNEEERFVNYNLVMIMLMIAVQSLSWMFLKAPPMRIRPAHSSPSVIVDAFDLATDLRGINWKRSSESYIIPENRPMDSIRAFVFHTLRSMFLHAFVNLVLMQAIKSFTAGVAGSTAGQLTIFDQSLPFHFRYLRSSIITIMTGMATQTGMQVVYDALTVFAILFLGQDLARWPPLFKNPWGATSIIDFWTYRWHQLFRHTFLVGAYPFSVAFGRVGTIVGAFISSGFIHYLTLIPLDRQAEMWQMLVGFGMMGPLALVERAFYKSTGKKVCGVLGWVWAMVWLLVFGHVIVDGFLRVRMFIMPPTFLRSSKLSMEMCALVETLVLDFDAWLHTI